MESVDIGFGLQFLMQNVTQDDGSIRQLMAVNTVDINVDIDRNDIKIHIGGGFWTDLASIFKVFFKSTVVGLINTAVE